MISMYYDLDFKVLWFRFFFFLNKVSQTAQVHNDVRVSDPANDYMLLQIVYQSFKIQS